jgi:hypothetical protein
MEEWMDGGEESSRTVDQDVANTYATDEEELKDQSRPLQDSNVMIRALPMRDRNARNGRPATK